MTAKIGKKSYRVDLASPLDISIPVSFGKKQLSAFGGAGASSKPYKAGSFIGDVRHGGSCNCELYTFSPHLNGTHTEGVGHLTRERINVPQVGPVMATLITVTPQTPLPDSGRGRDPRLKRGGERDGNVASHIHSATSSSLSPTLSRNAGEGAGAVGVITAAMLKKVKPTEALIIRTLPNTASKKTHNYSTSESAYLTADAMHHIVKLGVQHLLVDLPSVDKVNDAHLTSHHIFWAKNAKKKTITELIYVPASIKDGHYLLNLQVAAFDADAAPSRPVLYKVKK